MIMGWTCAIIVVWCSTSIVLTMRVISSLLTLVVDLCRWVELLISLWDPSMLPWRLAWFLLLMRSFSSPPKMGETVSWNSFIWDSLCWDPERDPSWIEDDLDPGDCLNISSAAWLETLTASSSEARAVILPRISSWNFYRISSVLVACAWEVCRIISSFIFSFV